MPSIATGCGVVWAPAERLRFSGTAPRACADLPPPASAPAQTFPRDLPREKVDFAAAAIKLVEGEKGIPLSEEQKTRIVLAEQVRGTLCQ